MKVDHPTDSQTGQLRDLWKEAFGDPDWFLDCFYSTAYSPQRSLCVLDGDIVAAALYWIDCTLEEEKLAYIYGVVTRPDYRGKGLCRELMERTHALLSGQGYAGAILVPQKESLRIMYAGMGYRDAGGQSRISCTAGEDPVSLRAIGPEEFAALRRQLLPEHSVIQEGVGLQFLARQLQFYTGSGFLLAAYAEDGVLHGVELLGDPSCAPGILKALGATRGSFRTPGTDIPFAMFHPLSQTIFPPVYFGFAFD